MQRPKQNHVCRHIKRVQNGDRNAPRLHIPDAIGIGQQKSAEEPSEDEICQLAIKPVSKDHEAEMAGVRMLEDLGEIGNREHDEQNRDHGKEPPRCGDAAAEDSTGLMRSLHLKL